MRNSLASVPLYIICQPWGRSGMPVVITPAVIGNMSIRHSHACISCFTKVPQSINSPDLVPAKRRHYHHWSHRDTAFVWKVQLLQSQPPLQSHTGYGFRSAEPAKGGNLEEASFYHPGHNSQPRYANILDACWNPLSASQGLDFSF